MQFLNWNIISIYSVIFHIYICSYYSLILKHNETYLKFLNRKDIASSFLTYDIISQNKLLSDLIDTENTPPLVAILSTTPLRECIRIMNENVLYKEYFLYSIRTVIVC